MAKFYFYEEICYLVEGADSDEAWKKFSNFTDADRDAAYKDSHVEVTNAPD